MYPNFHFSLVTVVICLVIISSVNTSDSVISDTPDRWALGSQSKSFGSNNPSDLHLKTSNKNGVKLRNSHRSQRKRGRGAEGGGGSRGQRQRMNKNALRLLSGNADTIEGGGAFPSLINIAPRATATVNATCGLSGREEYCKLVDAYPHRTLATQCGICDNQSRDASKRHPIDEILSNSNGSWQSPTLQYGKQNEFVTITLDLGQVYQVLSIILTAAESPRPASWILERSMDNVSYEPWQYFGFSDIDCRRRYGVPGQTGKYVFKSDTEVICSTQFSKPLPLKGGEIHISLLKNRPRSLNQSQNLMNFIAARFIRIRFQGMHSTANSDNSVGWLLDSESLEKISFYSVEKIRIIGRLHCNGHATKTVEVTNENDEIMHQCICLHNTCGSYCEQCCPLYNEKPYQQGTLKVENNCERCQCNGHASTCFYEQTSVMGGVCQNCTHHTTGRNCENCVAGFYRPPEVAADSEEPCLQCECDSEGSTGICDSVSGECECREGFTGSRCEDCLPGYKGDHCQSCICDVRGTITGGECEDHCQCKVNVEGGTCSTCVSGYFGLRPDNREGCMKCFCSGVGVSCRSLEMETSSYETLDAWKVTDITKRILAYPARDNDTGNMVFDTDELSEVEAIYWLAPRSYTGNRLTSYGSKLVIQISWIVIRGDTSGKPTTGPNIILIGRNGAKIANGDEEFSDSSASLDVLLTERGWYHVPKSVKDIVTRLRRTEYRGDPVTRIQFMAVLTDIESILIRGTFHTDQVGSVLERATLYSGGTDIEDNEWSLVEECQCPPGYTGLSCESCSFGYVRIFENSTSHEIIGKCIPCECNGHAESCNFQSGQCGKCAHNTFGDRCQRCKMGYFGNPMHGTASDCKRCACPLLEESNNFSPSCQLKKLSLDTNQYDLENDVDYVCTQCPDGYIGDHCELCDDGYYGNPLLISSACLPCPCNGGPCDPITGECVTCLGNTEGWRCERCRTGFWGNPEVSCEPCVCFDGGSSSAMCNPKTGQCECKLHFGGLKCDQCERGRADLKLDCAECRCNTNGSVDQWCNSDDGQCVCKSGVDGLKCDKCDEDYFGFAADGCEGEYIFFIFLI